MLLITSILGIFLSVILLYYNARNYKSSIYLGLFFFIISLYGFSQHAILYSKSSLFIIVMLHTAFLYYLAGPLLYWYVRSVLNDDARLKKRDLIHLLPMGVFFAFFIPFLISPYAYKNEIASSIINNSAHIYDTKITPLADIFSVHAVFLSRPVLLFIYTLWSIGIFIRFLKGKNQSQVFSKQRYVKKWLIIFLGFLCILVMSHLVLIFGTIPAYLAFSFLQVLSAIGLAGLIATPFFFPGILYGLPRPPESFEINKETIFLNENNSDNIKKQTQFFESEYLQSIGLKVDSCMKEFQPHLQPDFNLAHFSVITQIPIHHLSFYFREEKKQRFNDYRNEWRINHAKALIKEGKAIEMTMEAIGLLSGFSTRNTFFTAFKKVEGISPGAFANQFTA